MKPASYIKRPSDDFRLTRHAYLICSSSRRRRRLIFVMANSPKALAVKTILTLSHLKLCSEFTHLKPFTQRYIRSFGSGYTGVV
jgi:hypothetical protein